MTPYNAHIVKTQHLGFCSTLTDTINMILTKHQRILFDFIDEHTDDIITYYFCNEEITKLALFQPVRSPSHPIYFIIHQLILSSLTDFIYSYVEKFNSLQTVTLAIVSSVQMDNLSEIWSTHSRLLKEWEKSINVPKKDKKQYHRKRLQNHLIWTSP
ncbi:13649_t:CDS:1 [Rhizophagus irregularis]|nr:13649_t:CDS:1 [Rhizophagus irregularis]